MDQHQRRTSLVALVPVVNPGTVVHGEKLRCRIGIFGINDICRDFILVEEHRQGSEQNHDGYQAVSNDFHGSPRGTCR